MDRYVLIGGRDKREKSVKMRESLVVIRWGFFVFREFWGVQRLYAGLYYY